jgi:lipopolysaccharide/colanic/teichoic acid biosynthesis glycosyltransferase
MVKLRVYILLLVLWVVALFNIERIDSLQLDIPSSLYVVTAIALLPTVLFSAAGQLRFEYVSIPIIVVYVALRYFGLISAQEFGVQPVVIESVVILFTLWLAHKISGNLESYESVVDEIVFEAKSNRILSMTEGEQAVNDELFRARKYERPVSFIYVKLPSIERLRRIHPETLQYQLTLEHRYYQTRIARIIESIVYRVDIMVWYGDNLVICLPETSSEEAAKLAVQITEIIKSSIILEVPMGIASFPTDGLIYTNLLVHAQGNLKVYLDDDDDKPSDDDDFNALPEALDDPMTMTISSRAELQAVQSLRALELNKFHLWLRDIQRFAANLFQDIDFTPTVRYEEVAESQHRLYHNPDYWVNRIPHQSHSSRLIYHRVKRFMDISAVLAVSPLLVPLTLIIALAIKLEDGGSVFYSQNRTGLGGNQFKMYKFRSMVPNADKRLKELGVTFNERNETVDANGNKLTRDPRVTRVGELLRKTSIDELPQIWNVLVGDMSVVGPRPTSFDVDKYNLYHTERLSVKPGITGLWQIHDRGDTDFDNRLVWDIKYIDKFSLVMDLNILLRTVNVVIAKKGAR